MKMRNMIMVTAMELFFKLGLRSVSIEDICNHLHISKKTFYTIFNNKEELISNILKELNDERRTTLSKIYEQDSLNAIDKLLSGAYIFRQKHKDSFINFYFDLDKYYPEVSISYRKEFDEFHYSLSVENLKHGIEENLYRSDNNINAMATLYMIQKRNVFKEFKKTAALSATESFDFVMDLYIRSIVNENGLKYYLEKYYKKKLNQ
ncbi:MAG: TetR/AcrR family transcriptional regulator [Bacteroidales bacterium]|nr:TetR/AcrR family transcriptional regulator [Bacteroidales bacterium]